MRNAKRKTLQIGEPKPGRRPLVANLGVEHGLQALLHRPAGLAHGVAHGVEERGGWVAHRFEHAQGDGLVEIARGGDDVFFATWPMKSSF
jgi:hypothetical protein